SFYRQHEGFGTHISQRVSRSGEILSGTQITDITDALAAIPEIDCFGCLINGSGRNRYMAESFYVSVMEHTFSRRGVRRPRAGIRGEIGECSAVCVAFEPSGLHDVMAVHPDARRTDLLRPDRVIPLVIEFLQSVLGG